MKCEAHVVEVVKARDVGVARNASCDCVIQASKATSGPAASPFGKGSVYNIIIWNVVFDDDIPADSCCPVEQEKDPFPWGVDFINQLDDEFLSQGILRFYGPEPMYDTYWQMCWSVDSVVVDCRVAAFSDRTLQVVLDMRRTLRGLFSADYSLALMRVPIIVDRWIRSLKGSVQSTEFVKGLVFSTKTRLIRGPSS